MKKVININFQGRVVPIEETAYEILKQYIESLRRYFANEEGRDEIINDIESRIAELFSERLKKGTTCITDEDVHAVIASMGRPEDFDAQEAEPSVAGSQQKTHSDSGQGAYAGGAYTYTTSTPGRGRLYRNADDKILGGVCSGLANYLGIDPVVMRILFVVLIAPLFWVYILLWIIVPSKSIQSNITKRLYRSSDDKVIGGVAGGLAVYFNISAWIPRLIFALPLIIGLISGPFNFWWDDWDFWWGPKVITGSLGSTLFITYIILWIAVPVATTAAEKLEMRGERVDLNSIRNTVKEDLETFKTKAQSWSAEVKQTAQDFSQKAKTFGQTAGTSAKTFASEAGPIARSAGSGIGHVIGVLFKAFFFFIAGSIALALFGVFLALIFGGFAVFPLKDYLFQGVWQNLLAYLTLFFFFGIPLVALITWLIRRIMGVRSRNHYLGYVFGSLWTIGLLSFIFLFGSVGRNFKTGEPASPEPETIQIAQPAAGKIYVDVATNDWTDYRNDFFGAEIGDDWPFYAFDDDSLMLNTVRVDIRKSNDSLFHVYRMKYSRGNTNQQARQAAEKINFEITQQDSVILLPKGFAISKNEKWRNQQVLITIEVPVGKRFQLRRNVGHFEWFDVRFDRRRGFRFGDYRDWDTYHPETGVEYIMTPEDGIQRTERLDQSELLKGRFKFKLRDGEVDIEAEGQINDSNDQRYRYRQDSIQSRERKDSAIIRVKTAAIVNSEAEGNDEASSSTSETSAELSSPLSIFLRLFQ